MIDCYDRISNSKRFSNVCKANAEMRKNTKLGRRTTYCFEEICHELDQERKAKNRGESICA